MVHPLLGIFPTCLTDPTRLPHVNHPSTRPFQPDNVSGNGDNGRNLIPHDVLLDNAVAVAVESYCACMGAIGVMK